MVKLVIVMRGDNMALHEKALAAAVEAAEQVNHGPAYRAWVVEVPDDEERLVAELARKAMND
jgi:hypothetical protein